jgi:hypothetical protein
MICMIKDALPRMNVSFHLTPNNCVFWLNVPSWLFVERTKHVINLLRSSPSSFCANCSHRRITVVAWFTMICLLNMCIDTYLHKAELPIFYIVFVFIFRTLTLVYFLSSSAVFNTPTMCAYAKFDLFTHNSARQLPTRRCPVIIKMADMAIRPISACLPVLTTTCDHRHVSIDTWLRSQLSTDSSTQNMADQNVLTSVGFLLSEYQLYKIC